MSEAKRIGGAHTNHDRLLIPEELCGGLPRLPGHMYLNGIVQRVRVDTHAAVPHT